MEPQLLWVESLCPCVPWYLLDGVGLFSNQKLVVKVENSVATAVHVKLF